VICPLMAQCRARALGIAEDLPARSAKADKPTRHAVAFVALRPDGAMLLRRRAEQGMLGGMMEVPSTAWRAEPWTLEQARAEAPARADWRQLPGIVRHGFTHFDFEIVVAIARLPAKAAAAAAQGKWVSLDGLSDQALPTVMKKIIAHALKQSAARRAA
jgi:A/G-specific adenine glycosylase